VVIDLKLGAVRDTGECTIPRFVVPLCGSTSSSQGWFVFVRGHDGDQVLNLVQSMHSQHRPDVAGRLRKLEFQPNKIAGAFQQMGDFEPTDDDIQELESTLRVLSVTKPHRAEDRRADYADLQSFKDAVQKLVTLMPKFRNGHLRKVQSFLDAGKFVSNEDVALSVSLEGAENHLKLLQRLLQPTLPHKYTTWHNVLYLVMGRLEEIFEARNVKTPPLWQGDDQPSPFLCLVRGLLDHCNEDIGSFPSLRKQIELGRKQFGTLSRPRKGGILDDQLQGLSVYRRFPGWPQRAVGM
jgi:hypothetical protein